MNYQIDRNSHSEASIIIAHVYKALKEKGYDPVNQIVGYILSGDPTYITGHNNARNLISKLERDELLEEIVDTYIKKTVGK
ncbi:MAG: IreB family regulatory phosphoprotein [Clostridiales bacterium]|nr:IreB family regulatory phosphoprotein [Clostridiales bacterium]MCD8158075.1 IreB family regulatory phosphoprotein [Clostridiales bacterium]